MVDTVVFLKVLIALSGCIIIISIMNYLIGNDKKQQIKTIAMAVGMLFWSLVLWLYFGKNIHYDSLLTLYIGILIPVVGMMTGWCGLKLFRKIFCNIKTRYSDS